MIRPRGEQGGFALIAVLLVLGFVAVIGAEFAYSMRLEATAARVYKETLIATHLAEAGIEQATRELVADFNFVALADEKDPGVDPICPLVFYTAARVPIKRLPHHNVALGGGQFSYCITDEDGRLNLNTITPDRLGRLLEVLGVERADRDVISDSLLDWKDPNEEHRVNGAESEDTYLKLPVPYRSKNGNLDSVAELAQVKGVTLALLEGAEGRRGLADVVSVWSGTQLNANTASREVLKALGASEAELTEIEQRRRQDPFTQPARLAGRGVSLGLTSRTFRIEAQGLVDGQVRARITAIVQKPTGTAGQGLTILEWSGVR
jgi:general secretion pathway protein K